MAGHFGRWESEGGNFGQVRRMRWRAMAGKSPCGTCALLVCIKTSKERSRLNFNFGKVLVLRSKVMV